MRRAKDLSPEELAALRGMSGAEKLKLSLEMTEEAIEKLNQNAPEVVALRWQRIRRAHDLRNEIFLRRLASAELRTSVKESLPNVGSSG